MVGYDKHYLFGCKQDQPTLFNEAQRLLARKRKPLAETVDLRGNLEVHRRLYLTQEMAGFLNWRHLRTVVRNHWGVENQGHWNPKGAPNPAGDTKTVP